MEYTAAFDALKVGGATHGVGPGRGRGLEMVDAALGMAPQPMQELARVRVNRRQTGFLEPERRSDKEIVRASQTRR
jgi:hypothetical protein